MPSILQQSCSAVINSNRCRRAGSRLAFEVKHKRLNNPPDATAALDPAARDRRMPARID
jgi:hypothetical protein